MLLITKPPSDEWGRDIHIDISPYKKSIDVKMDGEIAELFTAKEDRFTKTIVNRKEGTIISKEDFFISDACLNKLVKYLACGRYIFWTENYDLFMSFKEQGTSYSSKNEILKSVKDFNVISKDNHIFLIVAFDKGLRIYEIDETGANKLGEDHFFEGPVKVSTSIDKNGVLHVASINKKSAVERDIIYIQFYDEKWNVIAQKLQNTVNATESIGNLEIGLDKNNAYIFYETGLWNSSGQSSKTWYTTVKLDNLKDIEMDFQMFLPDKEEYRGDVFVSDVRCDDYQKDELKVLYIKNDYDDVADGFRIYSASLREGEILNKNAVTKIIPWIKGVSSGFYNGEYAVTFLQAAGEFKNEIWYTESGAAYKDAVRKFRTNDYIRAIEDAITPYISGIVIALIRALMFLPAVFWLLGVEFFEAKKFLRNPKLNYSIAMAIYMTIKLFSSGFYYKGLSYYLIPDILNFLGMRYGVMILTSLIAYFIAEEYKKSRPDIHIMAEFLLFMLYDLLITVFLYSPYIT